MTADQVNADAAAKTQWVRVDEDTHSRRWTDDVVLTVRFKARAFAVWWTASVAYRGEVVHMSEADSGPEATAAAEAAAKAAIWIRRANNRTPAKPTVEVAADEMDRLRKLDEWWSVAFLPRLSADSDRPSIASSLCGRTIELKIR